jgi:hypothetical protein
LLIIKSIAQLIALSSLTLLGLLGCGRHEPQLVGGAAPPLTPLPNGRLLLFSGNNSGASFIALDQTSKSGKLADVWTLSVAQVPNCLAGKGRPDGCVTEFTSRYAVDCSRLQSITLVSSEGFNSAGKRIVWLPRQPSKAVEASSLEDHVIAVMCLGVGPPPGRGTVVVGNDAAVRVAHGG